MKCIKCIKVAKGYELDEIRRVSDIDADERVKGGYWKFIPKSEWKAERRPAPKEVDEAAAISLRTIAAYEEEQTIAEKQLKKNKKSK